jgi:hypothetical protein
MTSAQTVALQSAASQTIDSQNSKLSRLITRFCPMPLISPRNAGAPMH